jgi:diadenosine tetraphosphate (Ap4A) HIT family hydrolase
MARSNIILRTLFKLARSRISAFFIGAAFEYLTPVMPLNNVYTGKNVIVFFHPVPSWKPHVLVVPRKRIRTFMDLNLEDVRSKEVVLDLFRGIQKATQLLGLSEYTALVNGGTYQDVPQVHFHIAHTMAAMDNALRVEERATPSPTRVVEYFRSAVAYPHPVPTRQFHYIVTHSEPVPGLRALDLEQDEYQSKLVDVLSLAQIVIRQHTLPQFTIVLTEFFHPLESQLRLHIVSGARLS